jgi:hypothetical protein
MWSSYFLVVVMSRCGYERKDKVDDIIHMLANLKLKSQLLNLASKLNFDFTIMFGYFFRTFFVNLDFLYLQTNI